MAGYWPSSFFACLRTETKARSINSQKKNEANIYMLFAGWEVRIVKNCDRGLENAARGRRRGQHFQARGHSFSLYGPTLSRQIT